MTEWRVTSEPPIYLEVDGDPCPKGSFRAVGRGRYSVLINDCEAEKAWATEVEKAAMYAMGYGRIPPLLGWVRVNMAFRLYRPKSMARYKVDWLHATRPDIEKLARSCADALTGWVYRDDGQCAEMSLQKRYANEGEACGVSITVARLECV